jgi:hypothetical protein
LHRFKRGIPGADPGTANAHPRKKLYVLLGVGKSQKSFVSCGNPIKNAQMLRKTHKESKKTEKNAKKCCLKQHCLKQQLFWSVYSPQCVRTMPVPTPAAARGKGVKRKKGCFWDHPEEEKE